MELAHSYQASIRERHGRLAVFPYELADCGDMIVGLERRPDNFALDELQDRIRVSSVLTQQEAGFRDYCLIGEKGRADLLLLRPRPVMVSIAAV